MRNIDHLIRQVNDVLAKLEEDQRRKDESAIIFYDPASGRPEPPPGAKYIVYLPRNGRD